MKLSILASMDGPPSSGGCLSWRFRRLNLFLSRIERIRLYLLPKT
jgi:hypothetical protein